MLPVSAPAAPRITYDEEAKQHFFEWAHSSGREEKKTRVLNVIGIIKTELWFLEEAIKGFNEASNEAPVNTQEASELQDWVVLDSNRPRKETQKDQEEIHERIKNLYSRIGELGNLLTSFKEAKNKSSSAFQRMGAAWSKKNRETTSSLIQEVNSCRARLEKLNSCLFGE